MKTFSIKKALSFACEHMWGGSRVILVPAVYSCLLSVALYLLIPLKGMDLILSGVDDLFRVIHASQFEIGLVYTLGFLVNSIITACMMYLLLKFFMKKLDFKWVKHDTFSEAAIKIALLAIAAPVVSLIGSGGNALLAFVPSGYVQAKVLFKFVRSLMVLVGFYFWIRLALYTQFIVLKDVSIMDAFVASFKSTKDNIIRFIALSAILAFLCLLLVVLGTIIVAVLAYFFSFSDLAWERVILVISVPIGAVIVLPFLSAVDSHVYYQLVVVNNEDKMGRGE